MQCPNCGGYKTTTSEVWRDPSTGKTIPGIVIGELTGCLLQMWALGSVIWTLIVVSLALVFGLEILVFIVPPWALFFLIRILASRLERRVDRVKSEGVQETEYYCDLCGYRWHDGDAPPPNPSPNLDSFAQRLQEEEEERRRQS